MRHVLLMALAMTLPGVGVTALPAEPKPGPPEAGWEEQVRSLVEQLGHDEFQRREAAERALLQQGPKIVPVLDKLGPHTDAEIQRRLRRIRRHLTGFFDDLRRRLAALPQTSYRSRRALPADLKQLIASHQPRSGNYLLSILGNADDKLQRQACDAFLQTWNSMASWQIRSYLQLGMTPYAELRGQYPQGVDASIQTGYRFRYVLRQGPGDGAPEMPTVTTRYVDGKVYGKPFAYRGLGAATGAIRTKDLALGTHSLFLVTEYKLVRNGHTYPGRAISQRYHLEIVPAETPDHLLAPDDPTIDQLVRQSLRFAETRSELSDQPAGALSFPLEPREDPREPNLHFTSRTGRSGSLHMPVWKLTRELPVDLCFEVEIRVEGTGEVFHGAPLVVIKGQKRRGWMFPRLPAANFAEGKQGLVPIRFVLTPSRALALTHTDVTRYYPGTITSKTLRAKVTHH